ncbi:MAG: TlpA family protein disulfide reductase [Fibrobacteria bacterium]|nr:TlpA family protein disulfide reductase [Fibrobacteria bacterium]
MKNISVISIVLFLTCSLSFSKAEEASAKDDTLRVGDEAPVIVLRSLGGKFVRLNEFCGKKLYHPWKNKTKYNVILSFWATDCVPCKKEIPILEKMVQKYQKDVKLLLVSIDQKGEEIVAPFIEETGFKSTVLLDMHRKTAERWQAKKVPSLFMVDKDGVIRYSAAGYTGEAQLVKFEKMLRKHLGLPLLKELEIPADSAEVKPDSTK